MWTKSVILVFTLGVVVTLAQDHGELVFTQVMYRHGARTPTRSYPNDPYKDPSLWPYGWGQLTDLGKQQQYQLGKWLRQHYDGYLSTKFNESEVYIQSTDVDRTLMSAYSNLAGLYEPTGENWSGDIKWTPVPVHTTPENMDRVLRAGEKCSKYEKLLEDLDNSEEIGEINEKNKDLYKYLSENTGETVANVHDVHAIHGVLMVEEEFEYQLPEWTKTVYPQPVQSLAEFNVKLPCYNPELARLKTGPLVNQIIQLFMDKINHQITHKARIYSAHDSTISNLLQSLQIFDSSIPQYCATVLIELRKKSDDHFVLIQYKNSTSSDQMFSLQLPGCDVLCPLDQFVDITKPIIPTDWDDECKL